MSGIKGSTLFSLCLIVMLAIIATRQTEGSKFCGKALANALETVCENTGYNTRVTKSIDPEDYYNDIDLDPTLNFDQGSFLGKMHNAMLMTKSRRRRQGIVDECCKKGCSIDVLLTYCRA